MSTVTIKSRDPAGTRGRPSTSANGDYVFVGIAAGRVHGDVHDSRRFRTETQTRSPVTVGQEARLDAVMSLAGVEAAATVVAKTETVSTSALAGLAQTFTKELTDTLPVQRLAPLLASPSRRA